MTLLAPEAFCLGCGCAESDFSQSRLSVLQLEGFDKGRDQFQGSDFPAGLRPSLRGNAALAMRKVSGAFDASRLITYSGNIQQLACQFIYVSRRRAGGVPVVDPGSLRNRLSFPFRDVCSRCWASLFQAVQYPS